MSTDRDLKANTSLFSEVLEANIESREGVFEDPHPFLRTAMRGLASRFGSREEIAPLGVVLATELYICDVNTGTDGFTHEPMPYDVTGIPAPMAGIMIRMTANTLVREAFGDKFADTVEDAYRQM